LLSKLKLYLSTHFSQHVNLYFIVILCFCIGITSGVFSVKALSEEQKNKLADYLATSFKGLLIDKEVNNLQILWQSIIYNLKTVLFISIASLIIVGIPLVLLIISIRGFVLGFTAGFLIDSLGFKGILVAVVSILPQNFLTIPLFIIFCVISISYSINVIKNRKINKYYKNQKSTLFLEYMSIIFILCMLLTVGSIIEAYICPIFLKGISNYLIN
jgi:stage II sporulation protein M